LRIRITLMQIRITSDLQTLHGSVLILHAYIVSVDGPLWLHFDPLQLLNLDPDSASQNNADLHRDKGDIFIYPCCYSLSDKLPMQGCSSRIEIWHPNSSMIVYDKNLNFCSWESNQSFSSLFLIIICSCHIGVFLKGIFLEQLFTCSVCYIVYLRTSMALKKILLSKQPFRDFSRILPLDPPCGRHTHYAILIFFQK